MKLVEGKSHQYGLLLTIDLGTWGLAPIETGLQLRMKSHDVIAVGDRGFYLTAMSLLKKKQPTLLWLQAGVGARLHLGTWFDRRRLLMQRGPV
jgi:hypothetical protein